MTIQEFCSNNNLHCSLFTSEWLHDGGIHIAFKDDKVFVYFGSISLDTRSDLFKFIHANKYWAIDHWSGVTTFIKRM